MHAGDSALHLAAWGGHFDVAHYLVQSMRCSPECRNKEGMKPVHFAVAGNHLNITEYLIDVDPNFSSSESTTSFGFNCLHRAAIYGSLEVLRRIIDRRVIDPSLCATNGSNALHLAAQNGRVKIVSFSCPLYETCI